MVSARPRDRILTTATELFRSEGIGAVGVNRIIGQADVAPMTLYRQFGNKDNLVAAALEQWSTSWLHRLADAMDRRGDHPSDRFDGLWDELQAWFAEHATYAGATLAPAFGVQLVRADAGSYCLQSGSGGTAQHVVGPGGTPAAGPC